MHKVNNASPEPQFPFLMISPPSFRSRCFRFQAAFSIVELLVVISIMAILVGVGAAAFGNNNQATILASTAGKISSMLSGARQMAITNNRRTRFFVVTKGFEDKVLKTDDWKMKRYGVLQEVIEVKSAQPYFKLVTSLETMPPGFSFLKDTPPATDSTNEPQDANQNMFADDDNHHGKIDIQSHPDIEYAYIEFLPTGGTTKTSPENIFRIERAVDPGQHLANTHNYARIGVAQHTGRVRIERP